MTRKVYRTAQGRMIDLGALQLQNENVRAVGNMNVNARGDLINADGRPIDTRNDQVSRQYRRQTATNVSVSRVVSSSKPKQEIPAPPEDFEDEFIKEPTPVSAKKEKESESSEPRGGLAAAIARAREVTQEPIQPLITQPKGITRV